MDAQSYLESCISGNPSILQFTQTLPISEVRWLTYSVDSLGRNGLHLAVLNGHWNLALEILRTLKVSPHKLTGSGESIYHSIARGMAVASPTDSDYAELREKMRKLWNDQNQRNINSIESREVSDSSLEPPMYILLKNVDKDIDDLFGDPRLALPKYILMKYNVVLNQKNSEGFDPASLALQLGQNDLSEFYRTESQPGAVKKRMIDCLNENMFRRVVKFL